MSTNELTWMGGYEMATKIRARDISPVEAVDAALAQLERTEPHLNAFVTVTAEAARAQGRQAEERLMASNGNDLGALFGVPITVKDLCDTAGVRTTYGSKAFADHVPTEDSIAWARLKAAGAILIGKTTTPEFGALGVTDSALTGVTNNPWRTTHTSGGSSGGAAASVAAGVTAFAWGSDGGGSVRVPAACCGVVGHKASLGRIPGEQAWESAVTDGPLTRSVVDSALLLAVTAGPHPNDPLSLPWTGDDFVAAVLNDPSLAGLRIAFTPDCGSANVDHEVARIVQRAVQRIADDGGAHVEQIEMALPDPIEYFEHYWSPSFAAGVRAAEATQNMGHPAMTRLAEIGERMSAVDYLTTATQTRGEISRGFNNVLAKHDLVVMPTMPVTAFPHPGEAAGNTHVNGEPVHAPHLDFHRLTEPPSHAGLPAITVPCGFSEEGLPVGLQIVGPRFADSAVLAAAAAFEAISPWNTVRPAL
ncbi:amidase [Okibacterium endophyticum]